MNKPLSGKRVLVTRPSHQAENLCHLIESQGGIPVCFATLGIAPIENGDKIRATLSHLESWQWLIFISANAVTMHSYYLDDAKIKRVTGQRVVAVGKATATALEKAGLPVDLVPDSSFNTEALLAMPELQHMQGQRCLIVRGVGGRETLADTLRERGAEVEYLEVYQRVIPDTDTAEITGLLEQNKLDAITITSGEALQNLLALLDKKYHPALRALPLTVVSDRIKEIAQALGFKIIAVTKNPSDTALLETVITCVTGELSGRFE